MWLLGYWMLLVVTGGLLAVDGCWHTLLSCAFIVVAPYINLFSHGC